MRGVFSVLLAAALWCAPVAQADPTFAAMADQPADIYVCIDPSPADPKVWFSSTDCGSGTEVTATVVVTEDATGTEIIVHVHACLEGGCGSSVCVNGACKPECPVDDSCPRHACRLMTCPFPW